jgi:pSer/pThr/pTyr-binding forkhead associated (FHA) protein
VPEPRKSSAPEGDGYRIHFGAENEQMSSSLHSRDLIVIGRAVECDVVIHDAKASRNHCKLTRQGEGFLLEDMGSKNGTYVDGRRIHQPIQIKPNQTFKIGDTIFYISPEAL